ncbi:MAG TPA: NAD(P)-binding domain-containing protein [Coleofasciculaceae cyanobacterium]
MKIGVIGSGGIGGTVGTLWAKAGHEVLFSSRNPATLASLVTEAGDNARAGTIAQAASFADVIFLAVYYWTTDEALTAAGSLEGKLIIDATNPYMRTEAGQIQRVPDVSSALELAQKVPQAKVVKAYNTLPTATLAQEHHRSEPYTLFYCGDDPDAKAIVAQLITDSGFDGIDIGTLSHVIYQEPDGLLYNKPLTLEAARKLVASIQT